MKEIGNQLIEIGKLKKGAFVEVEIYETLSIDNVESNKQPDNLEETIEDFQEKTNQSYQKDNEENSEVIVEAIPFKDYWMECSEEEKLLFAQVNATDTSK